jgi:phosphatidylserine decarboxylase
MKTVDGNSVTYRVGDCLPSNQGALNLWLADLMLECEDCPQPLHPVMEGFKELIETDPEIYILVNEMIAQVPDSGKFKANPIGGPQIRDYDQMLQMINALLTKAPEFNESDLVGFPINAVLDWSMGTPAGNAAFLNDKINAMLKRILNVWCDFLSSEDSLYVLNSTESGWMSVAARKKIGIEQFQYSPDAPFWGFVSWNDFFTRKFKPGERPVAEPDNDKVIVSACESTPIRISTNVQKFSRFWLKSQPYSLEFMMASDEYVDQFIGGTVYQAFLSAFNYHRWSSPVSGTIAKAFVQEGTYYSEALAEGFDPAGPNLSQSYITHVAARAIIFIESDDPVIGLMCFIAVGMAEVSSNIITVEKGQRIKKGDELGYFQFGGSTHCLVFRPDVIAEFANNAIPHVNSGVVKVRSMIAFAN